MALPTKVNYKIYQGSTFTEVLRFESDVRAYVPITAIFNTAPMQLTAASHGLVTGWRTKISNVVGMTEVNSLDYIIATVIDANTISFNSINATGFKTYSSGGTLEYNMPVSLSGVTARMHIRQKLTDTETLAELTTENGKIVINNTTKSITLNIPASETTLYTFKSAVYSLELLEGTTVTPFIYGTITLDKEVTR